MTDGARNRQARWREALTRDALARLSPQKQAIDGGRALKANEAMILLESGRARDASVILDSLAWQEPTDREGRTARPRASMLHLTLLASALVVARDASRLAALTDSVTIWAAATHNARDQYLANHVRGLLLLARGDTTGAIMSLERAIYAPTAGFTRTSRELGALYLARRRPADAVRVGGAALRGGSLESSNLYVTRTELHELVARAFDALGNSDSAAVHYRHVASALERSDPSARSRYDTAVSRLTALGTRR